MPFFKYFKVAGSYLRQSSIQDKSASQRNAGRELFETGQYSGQISKSMKSNAFAYQITNEGDFSKDGRFLHHLYMITGRFHHIIYLEV